MREPRETPDLMQPLWPSHPGATGLGLLSGGKLWRKVSFNDLFACLRGRHLSCLTSGSLHFCWVKYQFVSCVIFSARKQKENFFLAVTEMLLSLALGGPPLNS